MFGMRLRKMIGGMRGVIENIFKNWAQLDHRRVEEDPRLSSGLESPLAVVQPLNHSTNVEIKIVDAENYVNL